MMQNRKPSSYSPEKPSTKRSSKSTEPRSAKTSDLYPISDILTKVGKIYIVLNGKEKLQVSADTYTSGFYYPGKELTREEYLHLRKLSAFASVSAYLASLLSKGRYTEKQVRDKLKKYQIDNASIDELLLPYLENGIIDDRAYALDFAASRAETGYGKNFILHSLKEKGISDELLKEIPKEVFQAALNPELLLKLLSKKDKMLSSKTVQMKRNSMKDFLIRRGYSIAESNRAIRDYENQKTPEYKEEEKKQRVFLLKVEAQKCYNLLKKRQGDPREKQQLFYDRLLRKGFTGEEISETIRKENYSLYD